MESESFDGRAQRLSVCTIEKRIKALGEKAQIGRVHPHKFRRTLAIHAIGKGMPIEQVQKQISASSPRMRTQRVFPYLPVMILRL
nr:tyrosine-type recombinase/integrase [Collinsella tanakaei]